MQTGITKNKDKISPCPLEKVLEADSCKNNRPLITEKTILAMAQPFDTFGKPATKKVAAKHKITDTVEIA
jgi:hypothetical protein